MDVSNKELVRQFTREMTQLGQQGMVVRLSLTPDQAMSLISAVQLANQNPFNAGSSRLIARRIADQMQSQFLQYGVPHIIEVIRRGWLDDLLSKSYDVDVSKQEKGDQP